MDIIFTKIVCGEIFTQKFNPLVSNNKLSFSSAEEIVVVYGPNGTGKTSLVKVLSDLQETQIDFQMNGTNFQSGENIFHIIHDQNNRNIISGDTKDFLLGDNIRREFELKGKMDAERNKIILEVIAILKSFGISSVSNPLISLISSENVFAFIKDCANSKSKGKNFDAEKIVELIESFSPTNSSQYDEDKFNYFKLDWADKKSIIKQLYELSRVDIVQNASVRVIEENTEAIKILTRFNKDCCIVCDTANIERDNLLQSKTTNCDNTLNALDPKIKMMIGSIINLIPEHDPFDVKTHLLNSIASGETSELLVLCDEFSVYKNIYSILLLSKLTPIFTNNDLVSVFKEYQGILQERPDITDEDYLYVSEIINNSMSKDLAIKRDNSNRLRIHLSNQEFLDKSRDELPLSNGEQNFLSLTFEFLKAKNSSCPVVVIDDPVSSFDSIYKNKVVYAIIKMLHDKKRMVLTHNTDLIRLLQSQYKGCFKLYLLNNTDGEINGFIPLGNNEKEMLISLEKLLFSFREDIPKKVLKPELFLIAMIPFMRGYANIMNKSILFNSLTNVMHGYKTETVDIGKAYVELFGDHNTYLPLSYSVSVDDILAKTVDGIHLINETQYPLLDKTLRHSFTYLFLRLSVEKKLVDKFNIDTTIHKQLGQIISNAYSDSSDVTQVRNRIRLTAKKTLINEFNHFEGNLSIFQPAIDITDHALEKERADILSFIDTL